MDWLDVEPHCHPFLFTIPLLRSGGIGYLAELNLRVVAPFDQIEWAHEDLERLQCLLLLTRLKDRGLGEAVQTLRDMVEFYAEDPQPALPPAPLMPIRAEVSRSYTSTVPPFNEE